LVGWLTLPGKGALEAEAAEYQQAESFPYRLEQVNIRRFRVMPAGSRSLSSVSAASRK
jgi:hypothetical protein